MFDELLKLVRQHSDDAIVNNPAIPNQYNNAAIQDVTQQIMTGLQNQAGNGNLQQIIALFRNNGAGISNNPIVSSIISSVASSFASKFGVSQSAATTMASSLLPTIMNQLISKTNNQNDSSFDLTNIMQTVSGNSSINIGSLLNQFGQNNSNSKSSSSFDDLGNLASKFFN